MGDEAARRVRLRLPAVGLLAQPKRAFLRGKRAKRLLRPQLVPLALAERTDSPGAEHGPEVLARCLIGRADAEGIGWLALGLAEIGDVHAVDDGHRR